MFLNYVVHQWVAHFGALPWPAAPVVDDAPNAVADGLVVAWFPAQRPVQCQAFDHRVEQHRGLGVEEPAHDLLCRRHPAVTDVAEGQVAHGERVELKVDVQVALVAEHVSFDAQRDGVAGFVDGRGGLHARGEFQYGGPGELVERLVQQIVHAVEIVCHGAEGHVRLGGDAAMRGACHST